MQISLIPCKNYFRLLLLIFLLQQSFLSGLEIDRKCIVFLHPCGYVWLWCRPAAWWQHEFQTGKFYTCYSYNYTCFFFFFTFALSLSLLFKHIENISEKSASHKPIAVKKIISFSHTIWMKKFGQPNPFLFQHKTLS